MRSLKICENRLCLVVNACLHVGGAEIESPQVPGQPRSKDPVSKEKKKKTVKIFKNVNVYCVKVEMEIKENTHRHFTGCKSHANGQRTPRT